MNSLVFLLAILTCTCSGLTREEIWMQMVTGEVKGDENIPQLAEKLGEHILVEYVTKAGLAKTLSMTGPPAPFTVFGPTDAAFKALPKSFVEKLIKNTTLLKEVLLYHVLSGRVFSSQLKDELQAKSLLNNMPIRVNFYTVPSGQIVTAQGCPITLVDQNATNGVIHELGRVMLPPMGTVVDVVVNTKMFSTLKTAVVRAGLVKILGSAGPFTVFAPTDEAFSKLPSGALADLLKNVTKLQYVLEYHVISDKTLYSAGLYNMLKVTALNKKELTVLISGGDVRIKTEDKGTAKVEVPDVSITNGVIHVIDQVLLPPDMM